jgi:hypothetical protein
MGQPPQWGHFTSRVSVSITVAAPKSWAPWTDNDQETRIVPARYRRRAAPSHSSGFGAFVLALRDAGGFPTGRLPVADDQVARLARTASLTLTRSPRFALFAVALLTVKRNDRPMTIRVKVEDIGHELRSRSSSRAIRDLS